jgi:hypothetical protein
MDFSNLGLPAEENLKLNQPIPFTIQFDRDLIELTRTKLDLARYPTEQSDFSESNWSQGAKVSKVKALANHWLHSYDFEKQEVCRRTLRS